MGIPILTSEGFVGQRWIIDDYFQAGETLHCGDVVACFQAPGASAVQVWKISPHTEASEDDEGLVYTWTPESRRVIGVVHTPASKQVGERMALTGEYVPVVVQGLAKALSSGAIGAGEPVIAAGNTGRGPGGSLAARVVRSPEHSHGGTGGESAHTHGGGAHEHTIGQAGPTYPWRAPANARSLIMSTGGRFQEYMVTGDYGTETASETLQTSGHPGHQHGGGSFHKHPIASEDRAAVVGKCLTAATAANQVVDILVDIAG